MKTNSSKAFIETADCEFARDMYKPPVAMISSSASSILVANQQSAKAKDSK